MVCEWHLCNTKLIGKQTKFCSINCKNKTAVTKARRSVKARLVENHGGKCERCGWNEHQAALEFHHRDPSQKEFGIGAHGLTMSYEKLKLETDKCHLLCSNCHQVIHAIKDKNWLDML